MKWFKHASDNHRGQTIQFLLDELGYFGPFFKDTLFEMCMEKLDTLADRDLDERDCRFTFHMRVICSAMRAKPTGVRRALDAGSSCGFWSWSEDGKQIKIFAPILLDLLDFDSKRQRRRRVRVAASSRLELELELEQEQEREVVVDRCKEKQVEKSITEPVRKLVNSQHPGFAQDRRFTMEPQRKNFEKAMAGFIDKTGFARWNSRQKIDQALQTFDTPDEFWEFLDGLFLSLREKEVDNPISYAEASWRKGVLERKGDSKFMGGQ